VAYKAATNYLERPYGKTHWETENLIPLWTQGPGSAYFSSHIDGVAGLFVIVRQFNVAGSRHQDTELVYDKERRLASDEQHA
jgi:hypothetical protein